LARLTQAYKKQGKYPELIATCLTLLTVRPGDAQTWCNLADAYAARCKYSDAIDSYEKSIALKPNYVVAWNNLGNVHHLQGHYEKAVEAYQKAISINSGDATPWVWLCLAYAEMGKPKEARAAVEKVEKRLPLVASMLNEELAERFSTAAANLTSKHFTPHEADSRISVN
jgi:tetratricopeptide (TPR) repeat protein